MSQVFVIAEAGVNHNGDIELAKRLIDVAKKSGADAIKFQTFKAAELVTADAGKAEYQRSTTDPSETQLEMLKQLELSAEQFVNLATYCDELGIEFMSTPFDHYSLRLLVDEIGVRRLKISSGDLTNGPLLMEAARSGLPVIVSTGMANEREVGEALAVMAWAQKNEDAPDNRSMLPQEIPEKVTLLHCTTEYPAPIEDVNLKAMGYMRELFGLPVGYSDHTVGLEISMAAVAGGATVIEKHFTLDKSLPGPDHKASLEPVEFSDLVSGIRRIELALGSAKKQPVTSEQKNTAIARKSLVACTRIDSGELFSHENLSIKRPGDGMSPMDYWQLIGRPASRSYSEGDQIRETLP